jgi:hypothetical protein
MENFNVDDDAFEPNTSTPTGIMAAIGGSGANVDFNRTFPLPTPYVRLPPLEQTRRKGSDRSVIPPISSRPHTSQAKSSTAASAKKKDTRRHHSESEVSPPPQSPPKVAGIFDEEIEEYKNVYTAAVQTLGSDVFHQAINLARLFSEEEVKVSLCVYVYVYVCVCVCVCVCVGRVEVVMVAICPYSPTPKANALKSYDID